MLASDVYLDGRLLLRAATCHRAHTRGQRSSVGAERGRGHVRLRAAARHCGIGVHRRIDRDIAASHRVAAAAAGDHRAAARLRRRHVERLGGVASREGVEVLSEEVQDVRGLVGQQVLDAVGQQGTEVGVVRRVAGVLGTQLFLPQQPYQWWAKSNRDSL